MSNKVRVIDNISESVLFETTIDKISQAYTFAAMMEEEGLDIRIESPGLAETLIKSLGATDADLKEYKESMQNELEDHEEDHGCSMCPPSKVIK